MARATASTARFVSKNAIEENCRKYEVWFVIVSDGRKSHLCVECCFQWLIAILFLRQRWQYGSFVMFVTLICSVALIKPPSRRCTRFVWFYRHTVFFIDVTLLNHEHVRISISSFVWSINVNWAFQGKSSCNFTNISQYMTNNNSFTL